jgi:hypothetical protein
LTEGTSHTGNREDKTSHDNASDDNNVVDIRRLAGLN